jgi:hypothetical protein
MDYHPVTLAELAITLLKEKALSVNPITGDKDAIFISRVDTYMEGNYSVDLYEVGYDDVE